jgi:hypothetical protein
MQGDFALKVRTALRRAWLVCNARPGVPGAILPANTRETTSSSRHREHPRSSPGSSVNAAEVTGEEAGFEFDQS